VDKKKSYIRVGRRIRSQEVRVIDESGKQFGIMPTDAALNMAEELELDLVEVNPNSYPPVCKIMNYGKHKYETAKRDRERRKNQRAVATKEIKFRPDIAQHDLDTKVRKVRQFLENGHKVKLVMQFRGRQSIHPETGAEVLRRVHETVLDMLSTGAFRPAMEGSQCMNLVLVPK
jgi:translation initiation factor IF-3